MPIEPMSRVFRGMEGFFSSSNWPFGLGEAKEVWFLEVVLLPSMTLCDSVCSFQVIEGRKRCQRERSLFSSATRSHTLDRESELIGIGLDRSRGHWVSCWCCNEMHWLGKRRGSCREGRKKQFVYTLCREYNIWIVWATSSSSVRKIHYASPMDIQPMQIAHFIFIVICFSWNWLLIMLILLLQPIMSYQHIHSVPSNLVLPHADFMLTVRRRSLWQVAFALDMWDAKYSTRSIDWLVLNSWDRMCFPLECRCGMVSPGLGSG